MKKTLFLTLISLMLICLHQDAKAQASSDEIYNFVSLENPPKYPGGIAAFYKFMINNLKYPALAKEKNIQGNVHVSFVVEKDGSLSDVKTVRSLGYGTDEEAIRVIKLAGNWNPGTADGKPVRVRYNIPVRFKL